MNEFNSLDERFIEIKDLINLSIELNEEEELKSQYESLVNIDSEIDSLETKKYFSKKHDLNNAFIDIQSGSGGTEAQDWAEMLYEFLYQNRRIFCW